MLRGIAGQRRRVGTYLSTGVGGRKLRPPRRGTEAVITAQTRNLLGAIAPRGFESHPLRHKIGDYLLKSAFQPKVLMKHY